jgi:hypothetical protein
MPFWSQEIEARKLPADFYTRNVLGRGEPLWRHSTDWCFVSGSCLYNQLLSMVTDRAWKEIIYIAPKENPKFAKTTGTVDDFNPGSGISGPKSRRASACPNLQEWCNQPAHMRRPVVIQRRPGICIRKVFIVSFDFVNNITKIFPYCCYPIDCLDN